MKIKTVKKMNLLELIHHVWENGIDNENYYSDLGNHVSVGVQTLLWTNSIIGRNDTFTVTVEEELTEETEFDELWEVYYHKPDGEINTYKNCEKYGVYSTSISQILKENSIDGDNITLAIYYGSTLIWTKDSGIPESGVVEVSE